MNSEHALEQYGDLLTVANLADVLDVSKRTIYRLADSKQVPCVKVGRRLYFPKKKIAEKLELIET